MSENQPTPESPNSAQTPSAPPDPPPPDPAALAEGDPEIAALLAFEPVARKCKRRDGWTVERQRGFIAALARGGDVDKAAHAVGRTSGGAWKLRSAGDGESFAAAWDGAIDLFHARNPGKSRRGGRARGAWAPPPPPPPEPDPEQEAGEHREAIEGLLRKYWLKLRQEREARLAGRIVEADFYMRQLTWFEVAIDLGGAGLDLLDELRRRQRDPVRVIATPLSVLLDSIRRATWREDGEPERPPLAPLGEQEDGVALGERDYFSAVRDGDHSQWCHRREALHAVDAEAQCAWEEKAKADAAAWAARMRGATGEIGKEPSP